MNEKLEPKFYCQDCGPDKTFPADYLKEWGRCEPICAQCYMKWPHREDHPTFSELPAFEPFRYFVTPSTPPPMLIADDLKAALREAFDNGAEAEKTNALPPRDIPPIRFEDWEEEAFPAAPTVTKLLATIRREAAKGE